MSTVEEGSVRVGPAGWSYEDWKGIVYPPGMPRSLHPLTFLADFFDTVEVNSTFYRPPNPSYCASWLGKVEDHPRFRFSVKLWDVFTHKRDIWPGDAGVKTFRDGIAPLHDAGKLGALLVQFPWSFRRNPENRRWLVRITEAFAGYPLAIEFRHASWDCDALYAGLTQRHAAFCNIDQPLLNDSIAPSSHVTAPMGYVRLHGRNKRDWFRKDAGRNDRYNYLYSPEELDPWIDKIKQMKKRVNDLFVITNNHYRGQAIVNALEIQAAIGATRYALPQHIVDEYPRLKRLLRQDA